MNFLPPPSGVIGNDETAADDDEIIRDEEDDEYGTVGNGGELDICLTNTTEVNNNNHQVVLPQPVPVYTS